MAIGVGKSKYAGPENAPFKCHHCKYFRRPTFCSNELVHEDAKRGAIPMLQGKAVVSPSGCCNEFEPK